MHFWDQSSLIRYIHWVCRDHRLHSTEGGLVQSSMSDIDIETTIEQCFTVWGQGEVTTAGNQQN